MLWPVVLLLMIGSEVYCPSSAYKQPSGQRMSNIIQRATRQAIGESLKTQNIAKELARLRPTTDFIKNNGYPVEGHYVTTGDGYILRMDRIPRPGAPVIFFGNVLSCSSICYAALGSKSMAMLLYDSGYDVWLGNWRGNGLSLQHTRLKPSQREFWNFGFHEHGTIDLPAMVDYVLGVTKEPSLTYVGHSMGSTALLVTAAERPEYDKFINGAFLMAPVSDLSHHDNSPLLRVVHSIENTTAKFMPLPFPGVTMMRYLGGAFCRYSVPSLRQGDPNEHCSMLKTVGDLMGGAGSVIYPADFQYYAPSGISLMEVNHYAQLANPVWPGFRKYNYGKRKNREVYGQDVPPDYDLTKSRIPVYLYTGRTDTWTPPQSIVRLSSSLKNFRKHFEMPDKRFGHVDFLLNPTRSPVLYDVILQDIKELHDEQNTFRNKRRSRSEN